ncbi:MAG: peptidase inhibitor family I36 protein [Egibacteraceae bacterium]
MSDGGRGETVRCGRKRSSVARRRLWGWDPAVKPLALAIALIAGLAVVEASVAPRSRGKQPSSLVGALSMVGSVDQPSLDCASGEVCLYEDFAYRGQVSRFSPGTSDLGSANDQASSVFNAAPHAVLLYDGSSFSGSNICLNPNTGIDNLAIFGRNDSISSIGVGPEGCG